MPRVNSSVFVPARFKAVRCPASGFSGRLPVHLNSAHPHPLSGGKDFKLILFVNRARNQRARHHRAEAFHGEHPVNGQAG